MTTPTKNMPSITVTNVAAAETSSPTMIAASLAARDDVAGAFVIILMRDGGLDLGLAGDHDENKIGPLLAIADIVREHCDKHHHFENDSGVGVLEPKN